jgi:hypothetical protein
MEEFLMGRSKSRDPMDEMRESIEQRHDRLKTVALWAFRRDSACGCPDKSFRPDLRRQIITAAGKCFRDIPIVTVSCKLRPWVQPFLSSDPKPYNVIFIAFEYSCQAKRNS